MTGSDPWRRWHEGGSASAASAAAPAVSAVVPPPPPQQAAPATDKKKDREALRKGLYDAQVRAGTFMPCSKADQDTKL